MNFYIRAALDRNRPYANEYQCNDLLTYLINPKCNIFNCMKIELFTKIYKTDHKSAFILYLNAIKSMYVLLLNKVY